MISKLKSFALIEFEAYIARYLRLRMVSMTGSTKVSKFSLLPNHREQNRNIPTASN